MLVRGKLRIAIRLGVALDVALGGADCLFAIIERPEQDGLSA